MENLSIHELRAQIPGKSGYAALVVEKARANGYTLTEKDVYNVMQGINKKKLKIVHRALELIVEEENQKLASMS